MGESNAETMQEPEAAGEFRLLGTGRLTWGEFKTQLEAHGLCDEMVISYIDIDIISIGFGVRLTISNNDFFHID